MMALKIMLRIPVGIVVAVKSHVVFVRAAQWRTISKAQIVLSTGYKRSPAAANTTIQNHFIQSMEIDGLMSTKNEC